MPYIQWYPCIKKLFFMAYSLIITLHLSAFSADTSLLILTFVTPRGVTLSLLHSFCPPFSYLYFLVTWPFVTWHALLFPAPWRIIRHDAASVRSAERSACRFRPLSPPVHVFIYDANASACYRPPYVRTYRVPPGPCTTPPLLWPTHILHYINSQPSNNVRHCWATAVQAARPCGLT